MELENESYPLERLKWVKYRLRVLDEIESKLEEIKAIAIHARDNTLDSHITRELNAKIRELEKYSPERLPLVAVPTGSWYLPFPLFFDI